jgi:hypothetical protein
VEKSPAEMRKPFSLSDGSIFLISRNKLDTGLRRHDYNGLLEDHPRNQTAEGSSSAFFRVGAGKTEDGVSICSIRRLNAFANSFDRR